MRHAYVTRVYTLTNLHAPALARPHAPPTSTRAHTQTYPVYMCEHEGTDEKMLIRVYGKNSEHLIDREQELVVRVCVCLSVYLWIYIHIFICVPMLC